MWVLLINFHLIVILVTISAISHQRIIVVAVVSACRAIKVSVVPRGDDAGDTIAGAAWTPATAVETAGMSLF